MHFIRIIMLFIDVFFGGIKKRNYFRTVKM